MVLRLAVQMTWKPFDLTNLEFQSGYFSLKM